MKIIKVPDWWDSIRSITTLQIISTYCLIVIGMVVMAIMKIIDVPVFLAFLAGFTSTVGTVITFYYTSKKRPEETEVTK